MKRFALVKVCTVLLLVSGIKGTEVEEMERLLLSPNLPEKLDNIVRISNLASELDTRGSVTPESSEGKKKGKIASAKEVTEIERLRDTLKAKGLHAKESDAIPVHSDATLRQSDASQELNDAILSDAMPLAEFIPHASTTDIIRMALNQQSRRQFNLDYYLNRMYKRRYLRLLKKYKKITKNSYTAHPYFKLYQKYKKSYERLSKKWKNKQKGRERYQRQRKYYKLLKRYIHLTKLQHKMEKTYKNVLMRLSSKKIARYIALYYGLKKRYYHLKKKYMIKKRQKWLHKIKKGKPTTHKPETQPNHPTPTQTSA